MNQSTLYLVMPLATEEFDQSDLSAMELMIDIAVEAVYGKKVLIKLVHRQIHDISNVDTIDEKDECLQRARVKAYTGLSCLPCNGVHVWYARNLPAWQY